ncbi:MAG: hypothetical protein H0X39_00485 [Actinobacteria bacterium]|nr:hypothetical protein [Actinomycetota bacterium]
MNSEGHNPISASGSVADEHAQQELARIKAERAKLRDAREKREAASSLADELARERRALLDETAVEKAVVEHGKLGEAIAAIYTTEGVVIVKKPNHMHYRRLQDKGEYDSKAAEAFVRPYVVHPDKSTFDAYVESQPATLTQAFDAATYLCGARAKEAVGKS